MSKDLQVPPGIPPFYVWWDTFKLVLICLKMRVKFWLRPQEREEDLKRLFLFKVAEKS